MLISLCTPPLSCASTPYAQAPRGSLGLLHVTKGVLAQGTGLSKRKYSNMHSAQNIPPYCSLVLVYRPK